MCVRALFFGRDRRRDLASTSADRRTCLNSNHVPGKTSCCPLGTISYFTISTGCYKQALPRNDVGYERNRMRSRKEVLRWKVCLKCVASRIFWRCRDSKSSSGVSLANRELCIHRPNTKSSHRCFMNDLQRSFHYCTVYCSPNFIIVIKFYYCYRLKCNFRT